MKQERTAKMSNAPSNFHFEVHCPTQRPMLNILRRFVSNVAEEMGFAFDDVCKIEMAVDEACSNAFLHASEAVAAPGIEVRLAMSPDSLTIQIQDFGAKCGKKPKPRAPSLADYQDLSRESYRGMGILIMREFMDDVQFADNPDKGTLVTLRKFLKSPPAV